MFHSVARVLCRCFCLVFFGFRSYGARNVPKSGPVILASAHQSYLDPVLVQVPLDRAAWIIARRSLFRNPLFGWLIRSLYAFPVDRGTADLSALRQAVSRLKGGNVLLMFPEATRTDTGEVRKLTPGIGVIAHRSGAWVVPVAIDGAFESWPKGRAIFRPHKIRVAYGKPLRLESGSREDVDRFAEILRERIVQQQQLLHRVRRASSAS